MSARSTQSARLGYDVGRELELRVQIRWSGSRKSGSFGGWRVEWTNGPTVPAMRRIVAQYGRRYPAVSVADLGYDRCHTALAEAAALLLYVDRDQSWADCIETPLVYAAFDSVDWPERADNEWLERARTLLWHTPSPEPAAVTAYAVRALAQHARTGWYNAVAWLDTLVAQHVAAAGNPHVISLARHRTSYMDDRRRWQGMNTNRDLVAVLVELRNAITPLIEDLLCETPPTVERWLVFVDVISSVIPLCRQQALSPQHAAERTTDDAP